MGDTEDPALFEAWTQGPLKCLGQNVWSCWSPWSWQSLLFKGSASLEARASGSGGSGQSVQMSTGLLSAAVPAPWLILASQQSVISPSSSSSPHQVPLWPWREDSRGQQLIAWAGLIVSPCTGHSPPAGLRDLNALTWDASPWMTVAVPGPCSSA